MKTLKIKIESISAMLMHSDQTANPLNSYAKALKKITSKRQKTDDDHAAISELEFVAGLYYSKKDGYHMPGVNLESCFIASAKHSKKGTLLKQAMIIGSDGTFDFEHKDLSPTDLFNVGDYTDMRTVKVGTSKCIRTRPIFDKWSVSFEVFLDTDKVDVADFKAIVENAGRYVGLGDFRPRYGRFVVTQFKSV